MRTDVRMGRQAAGPPGVRWLSIIQERGLAIQARAMDLSTDRSKTDGRDVQGFTVA